MRAGWIVGLLVACGPTSEPDPPLPAVEALLVGIEREHGVGGQVVRVELDGPVPVPAAMVRRFREAGLDVEACRRPCPLEPRGMRVRVLTAAGGPAGPVVFTVEEAGRRRQQPIHPGRLEGGAWVYHVAYHVRLNGDRWEAIHQSPAWTGTTTESPLGRR